MIAAPAAPRGWSPVNANRLLLALGSTLLGGCGGCTDPPYPGPGRPATVVAADVECGRPLVAGAQNLYWVVADAGASHIVSWPRTGGAPSTIATERGGRSIDLAADDRYLYWAFERDGAGPRTADIIRFDLAGGDRAVLSAGGPHTVALAAVAGGIGWLTPQTIYSVDQLGVSPIKELVTGQHHAAAIASDGTDLFWITNNRFDLSAVDLGLKRVAAGGGKTDVLATFEADLLGVALGDEHAAVLTDEGHAHTPGKRALVAVPKRGGAPVELAERTSESTFLLARGGTVFWTESRSTSVLGAREEAVLEAPLVGGAAVTTHVLGERVAHAAAVDEAGLWLLSYGSDPERCQLSFVSLHP